jgi:hypothetical protein
LQQKIKATVKTLHKLEIPLVRPKRQCVDIHIAFFYLLTPHTASIPAGNTV